MQTDQLLRRRFADGFNALALSLRAEADPSGDMKRAYWDALHDLPIDAILTAADAMTREPGRRFFPTTPEWREAALASIKTRLIATLDVRDDPWVVECAACEDTGWEERWCPGGLDLWPEQREARTLGNPKYPGNRRPVQAPPPDPPRLTDHPGRCTCGAGRPHDPKFYRQACPCRATNRTYQRHRLVGRGVTT